ncbi:MAG: 23S rRNA (adenine(2503)-C(2))-methyltransferase RlmN [Oscillospiraceae bacterium]
MTIGADILSLDFANLAAELRQAGLPEYRAKQIFDWLHARQVGKFADMSNLPKQLREELAKKYHIARARAVCEQSSQDGTRKFLFEFADGQRVETVAMQYRHGLSVCLSTQIGCAMGCAFCASTLGGLVRSLTAGEILAQLYAVSKLTKCRADSIVLMGMGEPLDNFENVMRFCDIVIDARGYNLAARGITLSTCGIVPKIDELALQRRQLTLSVSLHAPSDAQRSLIMPINKKYPLRELVPACVRYFKTTGRRVSLEYAVIAGKNDSEKDAAALADIAGQIGAHINLIPVNPASDPSLCATRQQAENFLAVLEARGANATIRRTLGTDIDAACGQLRRRAETKDNEKVADTERIISQ